jgi:inhibitor of cysteine peptidase
MSDRWLFILVVAGVAIISTIIGFAVLQEQESSVLPADEIGKFADIQELKSYLIENQRMEYTGYPVPVGESLDMGLKTDASMQDGFGETYPVSIPPEQSSEYSTTNIQVAGIDEADFVKNDGKYIYILSGDTLAIIDANPAEKAEIVCRITVKGNPAELFLKDNRLVVFSNTLDEEYITPPSSVAPVPYSRQMTHAFVYDIRDRSDPELVRDIAISGSYSNSRMIGEYVYLITTESTPWYMDDPLVPVVKDSTGMDVSPDIYYFKVPWDYFVYNTITSFSVTDKNPVESQTYLSSYSTTLYASIDNLYIAYTKPAMYPRPLWDSGSSIERVTSDDEPRDGTVIHRFAIGNGHVAYKSTGDVPGHLLNQFSMDESDGYLRVATTVEGWNSQSGSYRYNNVYVLDADMETVGELEFIAPEEAIYSTRFIGDRLYMVTFKRIDPFFVIDLSDPENPGILGKLKIPGYSDYLHPYDPDYIIGVGKETDENQWGGVSVEGVKIALFDVRDVNNPTLVDKVEIGDSGTESGALYDHRAFLFYRNKNLLVIPIQEVQKVYKSENPGASYSHRIWQGAYVFGITPETGFVERGTVTHSEGGDPYSYYGSSDAVRRSLYIDDVLYTISSRSIIASNLSDLNDRLGEVELPGGGTYRDGYPMLMVE